MYDEIGVGVIAKCLSTALIMEEKEHYNWDILKLLQT